MTVALRCYRPLLLEGMLTGALLLGCAVPLARAQALPAVDSVLPNGSFEAGTPGGSPDGWQRESWVQTSSLDWDGTVAHDGLSSVRITSPTANDASWVQTITVEPNRLYLLSGWIKTASVTQPPQSVEAGANLCIWGTWQRTRALLGTNDWTYVRMAFDSGPTGTVSIGARLGFWAGTASGTAWFDDLRVRPILASGPHPRWKILVLVYSGTDLRFADASGLERHVVGAIPDWQVAAAANAATQFVTTDVPALTSGQMIPELTIRYPGTLTRLSPNGGGWWPSPADTAPDRDPAFDSVLVIWQPTVVDQDSGQMLWIGSAAGLALPTGTDQTYLAMIIEAATLYGHRNVFKHEWGHSVLFYYDAAGTAPRPAVNNHAEAWTYVNCATGQPYVWTDETDANPVPNSIYHNASGFTHDYYSGQTALATDPTRCLGINGAAWASGGPVSKPYDDESETPESAVAHVRRLLDALVNDGTLRRPWSRPLLAALVDTGAFLASGDRADAIVRVQMFLRHAETLVRTGRLHAERSQPLRAAAQTLQEILSR